MSQFVCDVAVLAANGPERTDDDNRPTFDLERRSGEREGLESLEFLQVFDVHKIGSVDHRNAKMPRKIPWVEAIMWG
ncbi:hypothetical protein [Parafrigoribacterium mesophilum]|uniref:hypothetical protein n=1 Tax=Parafrigoribacterium mesophilum TaxID=433646 RepID=UPI0031FC6C2B